jgi:hypothetical protein
MRCTNCGADNDEAQATCARCGSGLRGNATGEGSTAFPDDPWARNRVTSPTIAPFEPNRPRPSYHEPAEPAGLLLDLGLCAVLIGAGLAALLGITTARGAPDWPSTIDRLTLPYYGLALLVVAVYLLIGILVAHETPGRVLRRGTLGEGRSGDGALVWRTLIPTLLVTALVALYAGMTIPVRPAGPDAVAATPPPPASPTGWSATAEGPDPTPTYDPNARARDQARAVNAVLEDSVASRSHLGNAIAEVGRCGDAISSLTALRNVSRERRAQRDQARLLTVDAIPDGPAMQGHLVAALGYSGDADEAYAAWAQRVVDRGCGRDGNWTRGNSLSEQAQAAKSRFLALWNGTAAQFGLPPRTTGEI